MSHAFFSRNILGSSVVLVVACGGTVPLGNGEDASGAGTANTGGASAVTSGGNPAVGGVTSAGGANPAGGSVATGGTSGGIDCSRVGCAAPPLCSVGCTEPCGCCPCSEGTVQDNLVCANGCWASAAGGNSGTGGTMTTGGHSSVGGATLTGGTTAAGGTRSTGGALTAGGTNATGGAMATGGTVATGGSTPAGGSPGTGGTSYGTGGNTSTGGTNSMTSSTLIPQCITVNGTLGWGIPGQPLICASNCTLCEAMCSYIGTKSEGWYSSCSGSAPQPAGCTSGSFLIQYAICQA